MWDIHSVFHLVGAMLKILVDQYLSLYMYTMFQLYIYASGIDDILHQSHLSWMMYNESYWHWSYTSLYQVNSKCLILYSVPTGCTSFKHYFLKASGCALHLLMHLDTISWAVAGFTNGGWW